MHLERRMRYVDHDDERIETLIEAMSELRDRAGKPKERQEFAERVLARRQVQWALPREDANG